MLEPSTATPQVAKEQTWLPRLGRGSIATTGECSASSSASTVPHGCVLGRGLTGTDIRPSDESNRQTRGGGPYFRRPAHTDTKLPGWFGAIDGAAIAEVIGDAHELVHVRRDPAGSFERAAWCVYRARSAFALALACLVCRRRRASPSGLGGRNEAERKEDNRDGRSGDYFGHDELRAAALRKRVHVSRCNTRGTSEPYADLKATRFPFF